MRKQSQSALALHGDYLVSFHHAVFRRQHPDEQQQDHGGSMYVLPLKC
jgi:hypothetical protein